jgi:hypothetical protein
MFKEKDFADAEKASQRGGQKKIKKLEQNA